MKASSKYKSVIFLTAVTFFVMVMLFGQVLITPASISPVYAGSTLTPTSAPANTPVPPTSTPIPPPPTSTPEPSNNSGSSSNNSQPDPTPTPEPVIPQEIPELGGGAVWLSLILNAVIVLVGLAAIWFFVRRALNEINS